MNLVRYYPKSSKLNFWFDLKVKQINYYNNTSTEIELGKLLFYPQNPGIFSINCSVMQYTSADGIKYYFGGNSRQPKYYFPFCKLFKYIQNRKNI